jgi:hypothetical protein
MEKGDALEKAIVFGIVAVVIIVWRAAHQHAPPITNAEPPYDPEDGSASIEC